MLCSCGLLCGAVWCCVVELWCYSVVELWWGCSVWCCDGVYVCCVGMVFGCAVCDVGIVFGCAVRSGTLLERL